MIKFAKNIVKNLIYYFNNNTKRNLYEQDMQDITNLKVFATHQETFKQYKNMYQDKSVAIIATGPSLANYKPIPDLINIGVNKAFLKENITLDYIFIQDYQTKSYMEQLCNPEYEHITKFYGVTPQKYYGNPNYNLKKCIIPESVIIKHKAQKYYVYSKYLRHSIQFDTDIDKTWIQDGGSVSFAAMQFALFTNPKKIYLIGCDCSNGYYDSNINNPATQFVKIWKELKEFANIYYPETEIISVNPVGLKGIFKDLYQE